MDEKYSAPYAEAGDGPSRFFGMIANIDENVGNLVAYLKEQQLWDNTIFIFTTDNGTSSGRKVFNAGMRGQKGSEYDGGHRVPFFVHWPEGHLMGGRDVTPITAHVDVLPTLLDLCGLPQPAEIKFDGRSLAGLLKNTTENWPDRILVTDSQRVKDPIKYRKSSVMTNRWRLVNGKELFDIKADPGQTRNIADQHPKIVDRLVNFYENWWAEIEPTFDDATQIYLGHPAENPARLTSHDWITTSSTAWNQSMVRKAMNGPGNTGFWNVNVVSPGTYELELRRWPKEIDQSIHSALPSSELPVGNINPCYSCIDSCYRAGRLESSKYTSLIGRNIS